MSPMFVVAVAALLGVVGSLLWFTRWAEERLIGPDADPVRAKTR